MKNRMVNLHHTLTPTADTLEKSFHSILEARSPFLCILDWLGVVMVTSRALDRSNDLRLVILTEKAPTMIPFVVVPLLCGQFHQDSLAAPRIAWFTFRPILCPMPTVPCFPMIPACSAPISLCRRDHGARTTGYERPTGERSGFTIRAIVSNDPRRAPIRRKAGFRVTITKCSPCRPRSDIRREAHAEISGAARDEVHVSVGLSHGQRVEAVKKSTHIKRKRWRSDNV